MVKVLTAKLPEELIEAVGDVAKRRGVSRNRLVQEALEAIVDGRVEPWSADEVEATRLVLFRERLQEDRVALRARLQRDATRRARQLARKYDIRP
jgi:hypothetical protein